MVRLVADVVFALLWYVLLLMLWYILLLVLVLVAEWASLSR